MALYIGLLSVFLSLFSTTVMSYIAMATPIGPWIAPTLVLLVMLIGGVIRVSFSQRQIVLPVVAGSIGGIMATACGFSFPTLYFLDPDLFNAWLQAPFFFISILFFLTFSSGLLAFFLANQVDRHILLQNDLTFPIAQLVGGMIADQNQAAKAWQLSLGSIVAWLVGVVCHGIGSVPGYMPSLVKIAAAFRVWLLQIPALTIDLDTAPMLLAIGFVTGHVIALPLLVGVVSRMFLVDPCAQLFFASLSYTEVSMAFCSGMVLMGAGVDLLAVARQSFFKIGARFNQDVIKKQISDICFSIKRERIGFMFLSLLFFVVGLHYFSFPWYVILYLICATVICSYQMAIIAGKVGLAYLGRFATFVMVPAMLLFTLDRIQIVFIAAIVEISGGIMVDLLCGRKLAEFAEIDLLEVRRYQMLGLLVSSLTIGFVFFHLLTTWELGSGHLFAYKAQSRHLLINARCFDFRLVCLGGFFGWFLKRIRVNPGLVLGGLLMPVSSSILLILGGLYALSAKNKEQSIPFWSGIFTGNSLSIFVRALLK